MQNPASWCILGSDKGQLLSCSGKTFYLKASSWLFLDALLITAETSATAEIARIGSSYIVMVIQGHR